MKIDGIVALAGNLPFFDLATLLQLSGEKRQSVRVQLSRLMRQGKVQALRRGMYVLGENYRKTTPNPAMLANRIYSPSYLSFHWALSYYGLIPEKAVVYSSVTTRGPRSFENDFGTFQYRHIKSVCFTGYQTATMDGAGILIAEPEKALLDLWYIEGGEWTTARLESMRFQGFETVSPRRLTEYAELYDSPRMGRAVQNWRAYAATETKGTREL